MFAIFWFFIFQPMRCAFGQGPDTTAVNEAVTGKNLQLLYSDTSKVVILYFSPQQSDNERFIAYIVGYEVAERYGIEYLNDPLIIDSQSKYFTADWQPFPMSGFAMALKKDWTTDGTK